jgi:formate-dependent phosphoribosylglycinamide formyltransferase (GAR transformylase)
LPPIILIDFKKGLPSQNAINKLGCPIFIKLDRHHSSTGKGDRVIRSLTAHEAFQQLELLKADYQRAVVQGFVPGFGVGVFFLRWNKEIKARFMHRRLHEMPHTGGASSLRESWWSNAIADDAERKLSLINWEGVAMVEYRWNPSTNRFF